MDTSLERLDLQQMAWSDACAAWLRQRIAMSSLQVVEMAVRSGLMSGIRAVEAIGRALLVARRRDMLQTDSGLQDAALEASLEAVAECLGRADEAAILALSQILDDASSAEEVSRLCPLIQWAATRPAACDAGLRAALKARGSGRQMVELLRAYQGDEALFERIWQRLDNGVFGRWPSIDLGLRADVLEHLQDPARIARHAHAMHEAWARLSPAERGRDTQDYPPPGHAIARVWALTGDIERALELASGLSGGVRIQFAGWLLGRLPDDDPRRAAAIELALSAPRSGMWMRHPLAGEPSVVPHLYARAHARWRSLVDGPLTALWQPRALLEAHIGELANLAGHLGPDACRTLLDEILAVLDLLTQARDAPANAERVLAGLARSIAHLARQLPHDMRPAGLTQTLRSHLWDPWQTAEGVGAADTPSMCRAWLGLHEGPTLAAHLAEWLARVRAGEPARTWWSVFAIHDVTYQLAGAPGQELRSRVQAYILQHHPSPSRVLPRYLRDAEDWRRVGAELVVRHLQVCETEQRTDIARQARIARERLAAASPTRRPEQGHQSLERVMSGRTESLVESVEELVAAAWHRGIADLTVLGLDRAGPASATLEHSRKILGR